MSLLTHLKLFKSVNQLIQKGIFKNRIMAATTTKSCHDCHSKCGKGKLSAEETQKLEAAFQLLNVTPSNSLLKKYLTQSIFDKIKDIKTPFGSTLLDCIQSGVCNADSGVGMYAPDADAYKAFDALFNPIIQDYHGGFKATDKHPASDWGNPDLLADLDPTNAFIVSTRVRCGRSVEGFPFNPSLNEKQYKEIEKKVSDALNTLKGELKGTYHPLTGMGKEEQQKLIDDHFLFKEGDRFLESANSNRFWPTGRGIFFNTDKTFLVWINEEDHIRIISMQNGGDLKAVYARLREAVCELSNILKFSRSDRLGFLTFCPTNLGTTIRASVHIKLPKLAADKPNLDKQAGKFNLQVRGTTGEHTEAKGGVYDISNKRRLGLTEFEALKEMSDGISALIKLEQSM